MAEPPLRTLYGRRRGKPLRPGRRAALQQLLPALRVNPADHGAGRLDPHALFETASAPVRAVWLEIGFGAGEHLTAQAKAHPDIGFIGCEPFINGVARLLADVARGGLDNIRIVVDDAGLLLDCLAEGSIERAFLLFPDPWPKRRHNKRRFVGPRNIAAMARVLTDGGQWRMATDHRDYCRWMLDHMTAAPDFTWLARRPGDWRARPEDWPPTRYEGKGIAAGRPPIFLGFQRRPRN
ncbi:MAG: tRNA (guanosine(46)-N7)-methyltransferase TrmB [Alphaproteobacteria bacterium]